MFLENTINSTKQSGWIEVICGSMFSGKTEELIRRLKRAKLAKQKVEIFKPALDTRYDEYQIVSHNQTAIPSTLIDNPDEIPLLTSDCDVIGIDEAQFFSDNIVDVCNLLANQGKRVIVAGLDMDFMGRPFGPMPFLMATAEYVTKVHAICMRTGNLANYSHRISKGKDLVELGEADNYEPLSRGVFWDILEQEKKTKKRLMNYSVKELAKIIGAKITGDENKIISQVFFDSRNIITPQNGIFIAIKGRHNGHDFIEETYNKSIRIFLCEYIPKPFEDAVFLVVDNTLEALRKWAEYHLQKINIPTIGITGSNGKTIVKEWLYQCLWEKLNIIRSPKSFNSQIGLPLSILLTENQHDLGIFEVGISQPGEMKKQENVLHPKIGVLTNVLSAHLEYFKNKTELISEKIKLFKHSEVIIFNNEDPETEALIKENYPDKRLISFGQEQADIKLLNKKIFSDSTQLSVSVFGKEAEFTIPFTDEASVKNTLCVISILNELHYSIEFIQEKLKNLHSVSMRMELIKGLHNSLIINDTFNSDYISLEIALNALKHQTYKNKVLILTDIYQSGITDDIFYKKIADLVNSSQLNLIILIGEKLQKYQKFFIRNKKVFSSVKEVIDELENHPIKKSAILIKGARKFGLEKIVSTIEEQTHDTVMEINLQVLMNNVNYFKSLLKPQTKIIAMVKASSYGLGSFEVAETLQHYHIDYLAVAIADEGALLRKKGIYIPIMVMNPEVSSYDMIIENQLEPEIYSLRVLKKFLSRLKEKFITEKYPIHIKINTGMTRLGFELNEINELGEILKDNPFISVKSIFSHFAVSDVLSEAEFTKEQAHRLQQAYKQLTEILNYRPLMHISNTAGIVNYPEFQFDAVRLGIGMYGYIESEKGSKNIEPVITLKTVISNLHTIEKDVSVGYGRRFRASKKSVIATLPIGYADGIRRMIGNGIGYVMVNNQKAPIIGSICMDMMMIDVTEIICKEGDTVIILGNKPSLSEYAEWCQTIPYEILTSISPRVKRVYYNE